jgi:hypothetical protein
MAARKWPGAHDSDRAGAIILGRMNPDTTAAAEPQRRADQHGRLVGWKVTTKLTVEAVEVAHG